jgi:hypothetical protein
MVQKPFRSSTTYPPLEATVSLPANEKFVADEKYHYDFNTMQTNSNL